VLAPAYAMAIEALAASDAAIKHVIVLSDGKLYDGQGAFAGAGGPRLAATAAAARLGRITTSAIAIGADADVVALEASRAAAAAASTRRSTCHAAAAVHQRGADRLARPAARRAGGARGAPPPAVALRGDRPALDAYVATTLAPTGEPLFVALDGEPLLAVGRAGLGRSAA
jgi:Ca-activated chloride channel homolog